MWGHICSIANQGSKPCCLGFSLGVGHIGTSIHMTHLSCSVSSPFRRQTHSVAKDPSINHIVSINSLHLQRHFYQAGCSEAWKLSPRSWVMARAFFGICRMCASQAWRVKPSLHKGSHSRSPRPCWVLLQHIRPLKLTPELSGWMGTLHLRPPHLSDARALWTSVAHGGFHLSLKGVAPTNCIT